MNSALFADPLPFKNALLHVALVYMVRRYNALPVCFEGRGASYFRSPTSKRLIEIMRRLNSEPLVTAGVSLGRKPVLQVICIRSLSIG